jgi:NAD(P)H-flavin reductase
MISHKNPYQPVSAEVTDIVDESPTIKSFVLKPSKAIPFEAGQFVELTLPGSGEAPFTPSSAPSRKETMEISIMKAGRVTAKLHSINKGTILGIRGPLGKGYPINDFVGKEIYIVGGGVGLAPIRSLFLALVERKKDFVSIVCRYGAKTPEDFIYKKMLFGDWQKIDDVQIKLTVDSANGQWKNNIGVVTSILKPDDVKINNAVAVVCGPPIMMKFTTLKLLDFGFKPQQIYLSMEKNMSCGIGMCGHCMVGRYYVCKDGPVFTYAQIKDYPKIWD